ncbi:MAG TPA: fibronectin type III domain-containing protein [Gammaproteobacteria bacterium]|nr:fibronectin type III domain-containing protein [Gammaproteobacteria bacterium]
MYKLLLLFALPLALFAQNSATILWKPNTETDLSGYRVFYGKAPRQYNFFFSTAETMYTVNNLKPGRYYFAVTALDFSGNESPFSEEVSVEFSAPQDTTLLVREWSSDRLIRLLMKFKRRPTGNPKITLQWRQFNDTFQGNWSNLVQRDSTDQTPTDYWTRGDTLVINTPRLLTFNPDLKFLWHFRARLDAGRWVALKNTLRLVMPGELEEIIILDF